MAQRPFKLEFSKTRLISPIVVPICALIAFSSYANSSYIGVWNLQSSNGYQGYLSLDGIGGCSYHIASATLSVQAICISRELDNGDLIIYGTQEGVSSTTPAYGDQLGGASGTTALQSSTAFTLIIKSISEDSMRGELISSSKKESVTFTR